MGARRPMAAMVWMSDLRSMIAEGTLVRRTCTSPCPFWEEVDLDAMVRLLGADATLWDRRPPCDLCDRLTHFMASPGRGSVFRPLLSARPDLDSLPAEAWMAGWMGRR